MYKIAIFGGALRSINYGVSALTISQLKLIGDLDKKTDNIECFIFSDEKSEDIEDIKKIVGVNNISIKYTVRFKRSLLQLIKDISDVDMVIDLTYGDSFSDIYGLKFFVLYSLPKFVALFKKKKLVLAPQTIGPFKSLICEKMAQFFLKRADLVAARDEMSLECAKKNRVKNIILTSDLAVHLPYVQSKNRFSNDYDLNVGLNISSLLFGNNERFGLNLNYKRFVNDIISEFRKRNICVHLISHVYDNSENSEYNISKSIAEKYDNCVVAPYFMGPVEAKNYMQHLDLFIGSRMHATIGAFSTGVPVIPVAYSRKFEGLYGSIGYNYCIDCTKLNNDDAIRRIIEYLGNIREMKCFANQSLKQAYLNNDAYTNYLNKNIIVEEKYKKGK